MKSNRNMSCFPLGFLDCALLPEFDATWALYFSKYLDAYAAAGVNIWAVTVQVGAVMLASKNTLLVMTLNASMRYTLRTSHYMRRRTMRACFFCPTGKGTLFLSSLARFLRAITQIPRYWCLITMRCVNCLSSLHNTSAPYLLQIDAELYAATILQDEQASQYVAGTAFHW